MPHLMTLGIPPLLPARASVAIRTEGGKYRNTLADTTP